MIFDAYDSCSISQYETARGEAGAIYTKTKIPVPPADRLRVTRAITWVTNRGENAETIVKQGELKTKIEGLFATGKTLYFSDISTELDIDLRLTVELCKELIAEGKICVEKGSEG